MNRLFLLLVFLPSQLFGQQILLDEDVSEWVHVETQFADPQGDSDGIDVLRLKITNDDQFLYFFIELTEEIELQENNDLTLFIDTDNDVNTGIEFNGIGYEFEFEFGQRRGSFISDQNTAFGPYDVGLISSPTVTSATFELKLDLDARVNNQKVFNSDEIAFFIHSSSGNEYMPDVGSTAFYQLEIQTPFEAPNFQIEKKTNIDYRVLSYNVRRDALFNPSLKEEYRRLIAAIQPDIIGFQEIYNNSGQQAAELVEEFIPSSGEEIWYHGDTGTDNLIVSRYPVINQQTISGNSVYLLDAGDHQIFTIVAHPPCCSNESGRQQEIDAFMAFLRDSQNGSEFNIPENTPIIIMGDMNLVGLRQQQTTLITGDISNEGIYGPDFNPDWDGTALDDAKPNNPGYPTTFTWYSPGSSFGAGRLDYLVYSGSVLEMVNTFSLHTPSLDSDTLQAYGLEPQDTINASDHIPIVADFKLKTVTSTSPESSIPGSFKLHQNYPNPFNPSTTVLFELAEPAIVSLSIYSSNGSEVASLIDHKSMNTGQYSFDFDATNFASGVYVYRLLVDGQVQNRKMILVK